MARVNTTVNLSRKEFFRLLALIFDIIKKERPGLGTKKMALYEQLKVSMKLKFENSNELSEEAKNQLNSYFPRHLYDQEKKFDQSSMTEINLRYSYAELYIKFAGLTMDNFRVELGKERKTNKASFMVFYVKPFEVLKGNPELYKFTLDIQSLDEIHVRNTVTETEYKGRVKKAGTLVKMLDMESVNESRNMNLIMQKGNFQFENLKLALGFGSFEFRESYYGSVRCVIVQKESLSRMTEMEKRTLLTDINGYLTLVSQNPVKIGSNMVYCIDTFREELKNVKNSKSLIQLINKLMHRVTDLLTFGSSEKSISINQEGLYNRIRKQTKALDIWIKSNEDCMKKNGKVMQI